MRILVALYLVIAATAPSASAQLIGDLAAAWGEGERTVEVGVGVEWWQLRALGGLAAVERGLQPGYEWREGKTQIFDTATGQQIDPRDGRTRPGAGVWVRLELQPKWWGLAAMWDPRNHLAGGGFVAIPIAGGASAQGELRYVDTMGWLVAFRLRFQ